MKEKNKILEMALHSPKPSPQEMALSSSNSKDIIKDHHTNLTSHALVENSSSFAGSSIRSEKDSSIVFRGIKAKPGARQIISPIISSNKKTPAKKTDQSTAQAKFRKNNSSNNNNNNKNKVILHNRTQKKNHQMMQYIKC